jgi:hypothetical protein
MGISVIPWLVLLGFYSIFSASLFIPLAWFCDKAPSNVCIFHFAMQPPPCFDFFHSSTGKLFYFYTIKQRAREPSESRDIV